MKRFVLVLVGLALLSGAVIMSMAFSSNSARQVSVALVEQGPISAFIQATGRVASMREVNIGFSILGRVAKIHAEVGDVIEADAVVAELNGDEAMANTRRLRAKATQLKEEMNAKKRDYLATVRLRDAGGRSGAAVLDAKSALELAKGKYHEVVEELRIAEIEVQQTKIRSPFRGVIIERNAEEGEVVTPGQSILVISKLDQQMVKSEIDAGEVNQVKVGQKVIITTDAYPGFQWVGKVYSVSPVLHMSGSANTFVVWIEFEGQPEELRLGHSIDINIVVSSNSMALKVPFSALIGKGSAKKVAVVRDNKISIVDVKTGIESLTHTEIIQGLNPGDEVVVSGGRDATTGEEVQVRKDARK